MTRGPILTMSGTSEPEPPAPSLAELQRLAAPPRPPSVTLADIRIPLDSLIGFLFKLIWAWFLVSLVVGIAAAGVWLLLGLIGAVGTGR